MALSQEMALGTIVTRELHPHFLLWAVKYMVHLHEKLDNGLQKWFLSMCKSFYC